MKYLNYFKKKMSVITKFQEVTKKHLMSSLRLWVGLSKIGCFRWFWYKLSRGHRPQNNRFLRALAVSNVRSEVQKLLTVLEGPVMDVKQKSTEQPVTIGGCNATVSGSGLPSYTLSNLCDISRSPLQLAQAEQTDTNDLFPGLEPRGLGAPGGNLSDRIARLVQ